MLRDKEAGASPSGRPSRAVAWCVRGSCARSGPVKRGSARRHWLRPQPPPDHGRGNQPGFWSWTRRRLYPVCWVLDRRAGSLLRSLRKAHPFGWIPGHTSCCGVTVQAGGPSSATKLHHQLHPGKVIKIAIPSEKLIGKMRVTWHYMSAFLGIYCFVWCKTCSTSQELISLATWPSMPK